MLANRKSNSARGSQRIERRAGFTIIELTAAIAIIAVLTTLVLPAVQRVREAVNNGGSINSLKQLVAAENTWAGRNGDFTDSFEVLMQYGLKRGVNWSENNGHRFSIVLNTTKTSYRIIGTPVAPASYDICSFDQQQGGPACTAMPGADRLRGMLFLQLAVAAAMQVTAEINEYTGGTQVDNGMLVGSDIRTYMARPTLVSDVFQSLDSNRDGMVSLRELFPPAGAAGGGINNLLPAVQNIFKPGAGGEDPAGIWIRETQLPSRLCKGDPGSGDGNGVDNGNGPTCSVFPNPPQ